MRLKKGIVTSCKMNKTIVVSVDSHISHLNIKKDLKLQQNFMLMMKKINSKNRCCYN